MEEICPNCDKPLEGDLQKCKNCNIDIPKYIRTSLKQLKDDRNLLSNNEERIVRIIFGKTIKKIKWFLKWRIGLSVTVLGIISYILLYNQIINFAKGHLESLMVKQFEESRIKQSLTDVANTKGEEILNKQIRPEIEQFKLEIKKELDSFKLYLVDLKTQFADDYKTFSIEVAKLKGRNSLTELADKAIAYRDRKAFEDLRNLIMNSPNDESKMAAFAEVNRIKTDYATTTSVKGFQVTKKGKLGSTLIDDDLSTNNLISNLKENSDWQIRARAAEILANRKEKGIPDVLLEVMKNEQNLEVAKTALKAFENITGYDSPDVFGFDYANDWWVKNKAKVDKDLK